MRIVGLGTWMWRRRRSIVVAGRAVDCSSSWLLFCVFCTSEGDASTAEAAHEPMVESSARLLWVCVLGG